MTVQQFKVRFDMHPHGHPKEESAAVMSEREPPHPKTRKRRKKKGK
jgi:hypothetical protein